MECEVTDTIAKLLRQGNISQAIELMKAWLATAAPGEPEALLANCAPDIKPRVALLMRDLLARYPQTLLGVPTLIYYFPKNKKDAQAHPPIIPEPDPEFGSPCDELQFIGWLSINCPLPLEMPFTMINRDIRMPPHRIMGAVALFKSHPNIFDLDELTLPNEWWAGLFNRLPGGVHLSARTILPYPDALESLREMVNAARGRSTLRENYFINEAGADWAKAAGLLFKETCDNHHPHP